MAAWRRVVLAAALAAIAPTAVEAADLTPLEERWLAGVRPVLAWALQQHLPIEITVLPQAQPGDPPLALGYTGGQCELVFAMRGNPAAQASLDRIEPRLLQTVLEAMAAHEMGHCWRHRAGAFSRLPEGLRDSPDAIEARQPTEELREIAHRMRVARREEAFADLVGLAWTHAHHPSEYPALLAWLDGERAGEMRHGFHDTRHWLEMAGRPDAFSRGGDDPFAQATILWRSGLLDSEDD